MIPGMGLALSDLETALRDPRVRVIDVLSPESFAVSHVTGAINIPSPELESRAGAELPDKAQRIIVYCGGPT
jgi:rhodanese-related sulfurtransferase